MSTGTNAKGSVGFMAGLRASADLSAKQHRLVKISGANTVTYCSAATDSLLGVLLNKPESGEPADVADEGVVWVEVGGAVSYGERLTSDSVGRGVTTTTEGDWTIGQALITAPNGAGDIIPVQAHICRIGT